MSEQGSAPRPRQVTMAGWVGGAASLAMLLSVGDLMSKLHTVDQRQSIADFLSSQGGTTLNLDLGQALLISRIGLLVTGAASAATLVFAVFAVLRRDRSARIAMSVLTVPLLVCGVFIDPFLAGFIAAASVLLWTRPAADWFAGRTPRPEPAARTSGGESEQRPVNPITQAPPSPQAPESPAASPSSSPAPFGPSYGEPASAPPPGPFQPGPYPPAAGAVPVQGRPRQVTTGCAIAWATSGVVAMMMVGTLLALQSATVVHDMRARLGDNSAFDRSGISFDDLVVLVRVVAVLVMLWALAAIVVAWFAYRRQGWARIALAVSAVLAGLLGLVSSISFPGFLLISAAAIATTMLLFNRESSKWYAAPHDRAPRQQPPTRPW